MGDAPYRQKPWLCDECRRSTLQHRWLTEKQIATCIMEGRVEPSFVTCAVIGPDDRYPERLYFIFLGPENPVTIEDMEDISS